MRYLFVIALFVFSLQARAIDTSITLDRSWGLLVGDKITATVELPVPVTELDSHALPQLEKRYGPWLFLHSRSLSGQTMTLEFQVINVPAENREVATPELQLRTQEGAFITVPSVPMQIGSFIATASEDEGAPTLIARGDMRLLPQAQTELFWQLWLALAVLIVSGLIWLVWHFGLRPRQRLPFATAVFELNKMRLLRAKNTDAASRSLHHAFNHSAGGVVVLSEIDKLWQQCPWLAPLQPDIEKFYQNSTAHYFSPAASEQMGFEQMLKLARACRQRERLA